MKKLLLALWAMGGLLVVGCTSDEPEMSMAEEKVETVKQSVPADPDFVTKEDLEDVVQKFTKSGIQSRGEAKSYSTSIVNGRTGKPAYYVVNFDNEKGYMLVSANKNYAPVLAYVEKGSFGPEAYVTPGIAEWLIETTEAIDNIESVEDSIKSQTRALWSPYLRKRSLSEAEKAALVLSRGPQMGDRNNHPELIPIMQDSIRAWQARGWEVTYFEDYPFTNPSQEEMIQNMQSAADWRYIEDAAALTLVVRKTEDTILSLAHDLDGIEWNQVWPWNMSFPRIEFSKNNYDYAYVGCVAVAGGQLMRYHKYPSSFDWSSMPSKYSYNLDKMKIASDFLRIIADKLGSKYTKDGTEAHTKDLINIFKSYGYIVQTGTKMGSVPFPCVVRKLVSTFTGHAYIIVSKYSYTHFETVDCWTFTAKNKMEACYNVETKNSGTLMHYINWGYGGQSDGLYFNAETAIPKGYDWNNSKISDYIYIKKP